MDDDDFVSVEDLVAATVALREAAEISFINASLLAALSNSILHLDAANAH